ncbi:MULTISPECIES: pyridoxamine 5'-phosphate oxidase family protein [unclassified Streptosporangium]|uniref:pyridoxamine 5'-phosphate oxidase family protein n=1 Tax=unclassified Streptosporangium TaxID=2632669 RepID=UPI002E27C7B5|nr:MULTISPECIES: pyridoxamine 5'-phosphate oxidase family protein [unclassified Streptosporangium]
MTETTPVAELLFSEADATPISTDEATIKPWDEARACLESAPKAWLSTVRPDGRAHAMPVLLVWAGGTPWIPTRPRSRKAKNLAVNSHCVLTVAGESLDLVVEGNATRARDEDELRRVADAFKAKYRWELAVRDGSVYEDSLPGSPEYGFYQVTPTRAFGYGPDGMTATRWRFE